MYTYTYTYIYIYREREITIVPAEGAAGHQRPDGVAARRPDADLQELEGRCRDRLQVGRGLAPPAAARIDRIRYHKGPNGVKHRKLCFRVGLLTKTPSDEKSEILFEGLAPPAAARAARGPLLRRLQVAVGLRAVSLIVIIIIIVIITCYYYYHQYNYHCHHCYHYYCYCHYHYHY